MTAPRRRPTLAMMVDAGIALAVASAALRLRSFDALVRRLDGPAGAPACTAAEALAIRRALDAWDRRMPWRTLCFEQGLAAYWMLRRRRRQATLYYGAATGDGELKAHVWVMSGDTDVVGGANKADYAVLARFPSSDRI